MLTVLTVQSAASNNGHEWCVQRLQPVFIANRKYFHQKGPSLIATGNPTTMASTATEPDRGLNSAFFSLLKFSLAAGWLVGSGGGRQGEGFRAG